MSSSEDDAALTSLAAAVLAAACFALALFASAKCFSFSSRVSSRLPLVRLRVAFLPFCLRRSCSSSDEDKLESVSTPRPFSQLIFRFSFCLAPRSIVFILICMPEYFIFICIRCFCSTFYFAAHSHFPALAFCAHDAFAFDAPSELTLGGGGGLNCVTAKLLAVAPSITLAFLL